MDKEELKKKIDNELADNNKADDQELEKDTKNQKADDGNLESKNEEEEKSRLFLASFSLSSNLVSLLL